MSTDRNDTNMTLIQKVASAIVKPLTYICDLYFKTGVFPAKMKMTKVIPLYKSGKRN